MGFSIFPIKVSASPVLAMKVDTRSQLARLFVFTHRRNLPRDSTAALPVAVLVRPFSNLPARSSEENKFSQTISRRLLVSSFASPPHTGTDPVALLTTKTRPTPPTKHTKSVRSTHPPLPELQITHVTRDICIRTLEMTSPQENANGVNGTARLADPQKTVTCPSTPAAANGKPTTAARNTTARINGHVIGAVATMENAGNGSGVIQPNSASSLPATPPTSASQADTMAEQITPTEAQNDQGSSAEQDDKTAHGEDGKRDLYVGNLYVTLYHL